MKIDVIARLRQRQRYIGCNDIVDEKKLKLVDESMLKSKVEKTLEIEYVCDVIYTFSKSLRKAKISRSLDSLIGSDVLILRYRRISILT